jgi:hypothetical protein
VPLLSRSRYCYISSLVIAATNLDVIRGIPYDSSITSLVKTESIHLLSQELKKKEHTIEDQHLMLMSIIHVLLAEGGGNTHALNVHEEGIARIVEQCGGIEKVQPMLAGIISLYAHVD